jgi:hypothetical protein
MAQVLLVRRQDILKLTPINGNVDTDKITPFIKSAQDIHIQDILGTKLFERLIDGVQNSNLPTDYNTLLVSYVQPVLCHLAAADFYMFHGYEIANGGIFRHESENSTTPSKAEIDGLVHRQRDIADHYRRRLIDFLNFEAPSKYPEYFTNTNDDMFPNQRTRYSTGWVL